MRHQWSEVRGQSLARRPLAASQYITRGFTLLEVIIVVGIIVLLTALTVTIAVGVTSRSEIRQTENVLQLLDLAMSEWAQEADRQITWGYNDPSVLVQFDIYNDTPQTPGNDEDITMMNVVLDKLNRHPASQSVLRQIDEKFLRRIEDQDPPLETRLEARDAWDNRIYVIHPGRVADPRTFNGAGAYFDGNTVFKDDDGTIRVSHTSIDSFKSHAAVENADEAWEGKLGVCLNRRVCFVSAGPDGKFGSVSDDPADDSGEYDDTLDNIYSYPAGKP